MNKDIKRNLYIAILDNIAMYLAAIIIVWLSRTIAVSIAAIVVVAFMHNDITLLKLYDKDESGGEENGKSSY